MCCAPASAFRSAKMFCASVASSTLVPGQTFSINSSLPTARPAFSTSTSSVSKALGVSGGGFPSRRSWRSAGSRRNGPNSVVLLKTDGREALGDVRRELGRDIDLSASGGVNPQLPGMKVKLAADAAGQEGLGPAIFCIADDRMANRSHVRAKLMRPAREGLKLNPGSAIARAVDHPPTGLGRKSVLLVDMHLLPTGSGLLGKRRVDHAFRGVRHSDNQSPIDFAGRPSGKCLGKMAGGSCSPGDQKRSRCVLVETMHKLWPSAFVRKPVQKPIEMLRGLRPALRRQSRRFVQHESAGILVDHHVANELRFFFSERIASRLLPLRRGCRIEWRHTDFLTRFHSVAGYRPFPVQAKLAGSRPAGHDVEADIRHVPLEPAVQADSVVVIGYGKSAYIAHGRRD